MAEKTRRIGVKAPCYKHGACYRNPKLYGVWVAMMHRCYDPKRAKYKDYGGRGIIVSNEWHDPNCFIDWAESNGYEPGLQIDRINNDESYSPGNCRFVTPKTNARNRRNTVYLTIRGETKSVAEWCETVNVNPYTVYWWVREKGKDYAEQRMSDLLT